MTDDGNSEAENHRKVLLATLAWSIFGCGAPCNVTYNIIWHVCWFWSFSWYAKLEKHRCPKMAECPKIYLPRIWNAATTGQWQGKESRWQCTAKPGATRRSGSFTSHKATSFLSYVGVGCLALHAVDMESCIPDITRFKGKLYCVSRISGAPSHAPPPTWSGNAMRSMWPFATCGPCQSSCQRGVSCPLKWSLLQQLVYNS